MPVALRFLLLLLLLGPATLLVASCQTLTAISPDPRVAELAHAVETRSAALFAALPAKPAPDCDFDHNAPAYAELAGLADQLQAATASPPLHRAAEALVRAVAEARLSHQAASAAIADPAGPCMTEDAIALNADALARASRAIAMTQIERGDR